MEKDVIILKITEIIEKNLPGYEVFLFGSQARGDDVKMSDIDIAIQGPQKVPREIFLKILDEMDEIPTLRKIDVVDLRAADEVFRKEILTYAQRI